MPLSSHGAKGCEISLWPSGPVSTRPPGLTSKRRGAVRDEPQEGAWVEWGLEASEELAQGFGVP